MPARSEADGALPPDWVPGSDGPEGDVPELPDTPPPGGVDVARGDAGAAEGPDAPDEEPGLAPVGVERPG